MKFTWNEIRIVDGRPAVKYKMCGILFKKFTIYFLGVRIKNESE